jgi:hypothetical protein
MRRETRELPFDHPIAIYLRSPAGHDRRVSRSMIEQLDLDPTTQWRFEAVVWQPPGATAAVTVRELTMPVGTFELLS